MILLQLIVSASKILMIKCITFTPSSVKLGSLECGRSTYLMEAGGREFDPRPGAL